MYFSNIYEGKTVLVTGHTGFKGSWLSEWLISLGARVEGYSNGLPTDPSLFKLLKLQDRISHTNADVQDLQTLKDVISKSKPELFLNFVSR